MPSSVFIDAGIGGGGSPSASVIPTADNTYDLGSSTFRWRTGYFGTSVIQGGTLNLATTSTDGIVAQNTTPSTSGVTVQISPRVRWRGTAWDTAASETVDYFAEVLPASAATPTGTWKLGYSLNGAAASYPFVVTSAGVIANTAEIQAGSNMRVAGTGIIYWSSRAVMGSPADSQINLTNNAINAGIGIDVSVDGTVKVRNRAQNADGTLTAFLTGVAGTTAAAPLTITNGTNLTTATANAIENDGTAFYSTIDVTNGRRFEDSWNYFRLTGSGSGITTIADFFGTNDGIPLVANGVYEIEWHCYFSQATAGTATWTIVTATTALATLNADYFGSNIAGIGTVGADQVAAVVTTASSSTALPVTGTEASGATHYFKVRAFLTAGAGASNTRLRLAMSAGTATPLINSYFRVRRLSGANVGAFVA